MKFYICHKDMSDQDVIAHIDGFKYLKKIPKAIGKGYNYIYPRMSHLIRKQIPNAAKSLYNNALDVGIDLAYARSRKHDSDYQKYHKIVQDYGKRDNAFYANPPSEGYSEAKAKVMKSKEKAQRWAEFGNNLKKKKKTKRIFGGGKTRIVEY